MGKVCECVCVLGGVGGGVAGRVCRVRGDLKLNHTNASNVQTVTCLMLLTT